MKALLEALNVGKLHRSILMEFTRAYKETNSRYKKIRYFKTSETTVYTGTVVLFLEMASYRP